MTLLDDILAATRARVSRARERRSDGLLGAEIASAEPPRGFAAALRGPGVALIAEIKRASPSKGPLSPGLDPAAMAAAYAAGGAAALSVVTEPDFFSGSLGDLTAARSAGVPVLQKDFVLDHLQIRQGRAAGADAILLIVRILGGELTELYEVTTSLGMDALVEVHDDADLGRALAAGAGLIGINHRDLATFEVDPERTAKLIGNIPRDVTAVALSGVSSRSEIQELADLGVAAVLVGESVVTSPDPAAKVAELLGR